MDLETGVKDLAATEEDELDDDDVDDEEDSLDNSSMEPLRCFLAGRAVFSANSASSSATLFFNMSSELLADMVRGEGCRTARRSRFPCSEVSLVANRLMAMGGAGGQVSRPDDNS